MRDALVELAGSARRAGRKAVVSGRWLGDTVVELAPRIPVRDLPTLSEHHDGLTGRGVGQGHDPGRGAGERRHRRRHRGPHRRAAVVDRDGDPGTGRAGGGDRADHRDRAQADRRAARRGGAAVGRRAHRRQPGRGPGVDVGSRPARRRPLGRVTKDDRGAQDGGVTSGPGGAAQPRRRPAQAVRPQPDRAGADVDRGRGRGRAQPAGDRGHRQRRGAGPRPAPVEAAGDRAGRAAARRPGRSRRWTPPTSPASSAWAATSSRAPSSPPTATACSPCRWAAAGRSAGGRPTRGRSCPLDGLRVVRSLRQSVRRYEVRVDTAFERVVDACGDPRRPHGWITPEIRAAYTRLHRLGWAHSVEAWSRRRRAGRRPLRRRHRRAVRRRVDVPPPPRRLQGRAASGLVELLRARGRRRPAGARRAVARRPTWPRSGRSRCRGPTTSSARPGPWPSPRPRPSPADERAAGRLPQPRRSR